MRRANRLARRAPIAPYYPQMLAEDGVVATAPAKESKQERGPEGGTSVPVTGDVLAVARSSNQFAFELYKHATEHDGNKFFSPASISTALAMIYAGARDDTKKQMAHVLHFDLPDPHLHNGFAALNAILNSKSKSYQLNVANRLWGQTGFPFEEAFLKSTLERYGAEPGAVDFARTE
ncbi:MAG TPA: serpin family protein, partial [Gemmataceae bacterium]|nr:serpin family protein [Gemmataceae bacterium]